MIPIEGINPFGLETRKMVYHVLCQQGSTISETTSNEFDDRLYCYATFPSALVQGYSPYWTIKRPNSIDDYNKFTKYVSKDSDSTVLGNGSKYMIQSGLNSTDTTQDFYYYHIINPGDGFYGAAFILDTSGSMSNDYTKVKTQIASIMSYYGADAPQTPAFYLYSGTYYSNVSSEQKLGELKLAGLSDVTIYNQVAGVINGIKKQGGSESMMTCTYCAIGDMMSKVITAPRCDANASSLRAMSFICLTDENIYKSDTLDNASKLFDQSDKVHNDWLTSWNAKSDDDTKFPAKYSSKQKAAEFFGYVLAALDKMSYFYGINFSFALDHAISGSDYEKTYQKLFPAVSIAKYENNAITVDTDKETLSGGDYRWIVPREQSGSETTIIWKAVNPFDPMCCLLFVLKGAAEMDTEYIMTDQDKYQNIDTVKGKYHHYTKNGAVNSYCKYAYFSKDTIKLPNSTEIKNGPTEIKWIFDRTGETLNGGTDFTPDRDKYMTDDTGSTTNYDADYTLTFTLVVEENTVTVSFDSQGGSACEQKKVPQGGEIGDLPTPTYAGNTFVGWYLSDGTTQVTSSTTVNSNTILYAHWSGNSYSISWANLNGVTNPNTKISYSPGETFTPQNLANTTDYAFNGWSPSSITSSTVGNVTFTAQWTVNATYFGPNEPFRTMWSDPYTKVDASTPDIRAINDYPPKADGSYNYDTNTPISMTGAMKQYMKISWGRQCCRSSNLNSGAYSATQYMVIAVETPDTISNFVNVKVAKGNLKGYVALEGTSYSTSGVGLCGAEGASVDGGWDNTPRTTGCINLLNVKIPYNGNSTTQFYTFKLDSSKYVYLVDKDENPVTAYVPCLAVASYCGKGGEHIYYSIEIKTASIAF